MVRFIHPTDDKEDVAVQKAPKMQVLALGLSRCGTSSLKAALESDVIGAGPSMHMSRIAPSADLEALVLSAMNFPEGSPERQKLLRKFYDGYGATCDFPGWMFAADLMDIYPDAAVVLNLRQNGGREWADSITASIRWFGTPAYLLTCYLWETDRLHYRIHRESYRVHVGVKFGLADMYTPEFYERQNDWVREEAARRGRRVLEWRVGEGWGPLCEFLGKDLPRDGRPFPHLNDAAAMRTVKRVLIARGLVSWAVVGVAGVAALYYLLLR
ncbi:hypothetical protein GE09DRAFT_432279 [Coniochaeta sp. 2T2.1]|nr:hypothetical protein GE09DRAFT_432279 [Coniochaeta sp. 2T2.1]